MMHFIKGTGAFYQELVTLFVIATYIHLGHRILTSLCIDTKQKTRACVHFILLYNVGFL